MEVIFQGRLTEDQNIKEVLEDVLALKTGDHGVLRISSPADGLNGGINLYQRRYIVAAYLSDAPETGYQAVRKLLSVQVGNFAYMDSPTAPEEHESVCIDLQSLLDLFPELPETLPGTVDIGTEQAPRRATTKEIENAAELIRQTTQNAPAQSGPETLPQLREMQKRSTLGRKLMFWAFVSVFVIGALLFVVPVAQRYIQGNKVLQNLDTHLKNRIQGQPETVAPPAVEEPAPAPKPHKSKRRHRHQH